MGFMQYSCTEDPIIEYQGKNSIFFEGKYDVSLSQYIPKSYGQLSFGYVDGLVKDSVYTVVVNSMGKPVAFDRPYELSVVDTSTLIAGTDYVFLSNSFVIAAGKTQDSVRIKFMRNSNMTTSTRFLSLKLSANDFFNLDMPLESIGSGNQMKTEKYDSFILKVDDILGCPWFWDPLLNKNGAVVERYLGPFTAKKFQIMIARYDLDVKTVTQFGRMPMPGQLFAWAFDMQSYLDEQTAKGDPIYESDNKTLMKMGPAAK